MYVVDPKSLPSLGVPNVGDKVWFCFIMDATFFWQFPLITLILVCNTYIIKDEGEKLWKSCKHLG
jgi:hypothetical protein